MEDPGDSACQRATNDNRRTDRPTRTSVWLRRNKPASETSEEEGVVTVIWFRSTSIFINSPRPDGSPAAGVKITTISYLTVRSLLIQDGPEGNGRLEQAGD